MGIDEAGRGPVIGPMVVAAVILKRREAKRLREMGVTDSKLLSAERREELFPMIIESAESYLIKVIEPKRIDEAVSKNILNLLEAEVMSELIRELRPARVIVDSPMRNCRKFSEVLRGFLGDLSVKIIAENKADSKYVQVASASIIAKVERDRRIRELSELTGIDIGSGYPGDPKTREAIKIILKGAEFPRDQVRWKWATINKLLEEIRGRDLTEFLDR